MSVTRRAGIRRPAFIALAATTGLALTILATGSTLAAPNPDASSASSTLYLVQFTGNPLATYTGGVSGFAATKPAKGHRINTHTANATGYSRYLANHQHTVLSSAGVSASSVVYTYTTVVNGAAVKLTAVQAAKLAHAPGVSMIQKNTIQSIQTTPQPPTPAFLGLTGANGVWNKQFGDQSHAGEGVIVADIDTGFWPENPSFAPLSEPRPDAATIAAKFHGVCDTSGESPVTCNNKVIGARFYDAAGLSTSNPGEFTSPRDYDGHGSHTASTAAGDPVEAVINGNDVGPLSGMAPAARLSIYKVLYENAANTTAQGSTADIVAAVNDAINDGVDVINFSVGDNVDTFGAEELAFLNAAAAGVFVSAAAGNAGPGASTVDNAMPWETTVAAGTYDQSFPNTVTLGNGAVFNGVGRESAAGPAPLIDSVDAGLASADPTEVELCFSGTLDPAKVAGKIVLCLRGVNARVDKSNAVNLAGGAGMILYNATDAQEFDDDFHFVPTVHINNTDGLAIKSYIHSTANPTAALGAGVPVRVEAPVVAGFSSAGPSLFSGGDLGKPDIMAPGVDMVAAVSPQNHAGNLWDSESGTSMATPHIAGVAALLMSKHPDWSPMEVKSAMMTTANPFDNDGNPIQRAGVNATTFDMGSGEVTPAPAFDPGLVYDSDIVDWLQYSCGVGVHLFTSSGDVCDQVGSIQANQLNYASIAAGALPGAETITRTVTNVDDKSDNYKVKITNPTGYKVTVKPDHIVIKPGKSATYTVTITRTTAPLGAYAFGQIVWTDQRGHAVRSPISVQGVALAAPPTFAGTGGSGSQALALAAGYTGTLTTSVAGLAQSSVTSLPLVVDDAHPFNPNAPATSDATGRVDVTIPAGTPLARFATFGADYAAGTDIDIFVYKKNANNSLSFVGQSAGSSATETVTLGNPSGNYVMFVNAFAATSGSVTALANVFVVPNSAVGNLTATPTSQSVTSGQAATVTLSWTGLAAGHFLGVVTYGNGTSTVGSTLVSIDN
jgi:subtilisin family serine protease